jgi:hypothetical protein
MGFDITGLGAVFDLGGKIIDKLFPDKDAADKARIALFEMQQRGELAELEQRMKAIVTEAGSADPWTSRARPTFMYVIYVLILAALPFSVLFAFKPEVATAVVTGFKSWLEAIPADMLALFGVGYVGYAGARSYEKVKGAGK